MAISSLRQILQSHLHLEPHPLPLSKPHTPPLYDVPGNSRMECDGTDVPLRCVGISTSRVPAWWDSSLSWVVYFISLALFKGCTNCSKILHFVVPEISSCEALMFATVTRFQSWWRKPCLLLSVGSFMEKSEVCIFALSAGHEGDRHANSPHIKSMKILGESYI